VGDFSRQIVLSIWKALIFTYIIEYVNREYGDVAKLIDRFIDARKK